MRPEIDKLMETILREWSSDDPHTRLCAISRIEAATKDGIELPKDLVVKVLRAAMYEDFRLYEGEVWVEGLVLADKICDQFGWDFALFNPVDDGPLGRP